MRYDEDCRTAVFGKTERTVGWEGDGDPARMTLVRHCSRGNPQPTDRRYLRSLSHPFTLDFLLFAPDQVSATAALNFVTEKLKQMKLELNWNKTRVALSSPGVIFLGYKLPHPPKNNT